MAAPAVARDAAAAPDAAKAVARQRALGLVVALLLAAPILIYFHDRSWIPADDGQYAHIADRIQQGEILHRDVYDLHGDYVHWIHAASLKLFGRDLVSLRYPLIALGLFQAALMFWACAPRGIGIAILASLCVTAIGFPQISSPTPNLYALCGAVAAIAVLSRLDRDHAWRLFLLGFIVGITFWFRQLTGVLLAMGVVTVLCAETPSRLSRALAGISLAGLVAYLATFTNPVGFVLFGIGPIAILVWVLLQRPEHPSSPRFLLHLALGAALASAPLLAFHTYHGTLGDFFEGCFVRVFAVTRLPYLEWGNYADYLIFGGIGTFLGESARVRVNGIHWFLLPLLPLATAGLALRGLSNRSESATAPALPIVGAFYAIVALFNQIPYYLYLVVGICLASLVSRRSPDFRGVAIAVIAAVYLCATSLLFHAGQPYRRSLAEAFRGDRKPLVESGLQGASLRIDPRDRDLFRAVVSEIQRRTRPGDSILVIPNDPELYFLSQRVNPSPVWNTSLGTSLRPEDLPDLVVHNRVDKNNSLEASAQVAQLVGRSEVTQVERFAIHDLVSD